LKIQYENSDKSISEVKMILKKFYEEKDFN